MPTRKISGPIKSQKCNDPDHGVPKFQFFEPGTYEHECPSCGKIIRFTIPEFGLIYKNEKGDRPPETHFSHH